MPCCLFEFFQVSQVHRGWVGLWAGARAQGFGMSHRLPEILQEEEEALLKQQTQHSCVDCPVPIKGITWMCQKCGYIHRKVRKWAFPPFFLPAEGWSNLGMQWTFPRSWAGAQKLTQGKLQHMGAKDNWLWSCRLESQGIIMLGLFFSKLCVSRNWCRCWGGTVGAGNDWCVIMTPPKTPAKGDLGQGKAASRDWSLCLLCKIVPSDWDRSICSASVKKTKKF